MRRSTMLVVLAALAALVAAGPTPAAGSAVPARGLVLHYAMETLHRGVVPDDSASSLDGRVVAGSGSPWLAPSLRGYGLALQTTGARHQYVDVPRSWRLDVDRYTLSAWVRYTGIQNDQSHGRWEVLEKADAYWMNVRLDGRVRAGGFYGGCSGPGVWQHLDSTRAITTWSWRHVASTYDGTWLRVYVDGYAAGAKRVSGRTCVSREPLAVGAKNHVSAGLLEAFWDGRLDEVRIYNRALAPEEIRQLGARR